MSGERCHTINYTMQRCDISFFRGKEDDFCAQGCVSDNVSGGH